MYVFLCVFQDRGELNHTHIIIATLVYTHLYSMHTHTHACTHLYTRIHAHARTRIHTLTQTCMHIRTHARMHTRYWKGSAAI